MEATCAVPITGYKGIVFVLLCVLFLSPIWITHIFITGPNFGERISNTYGPHTEAHSDTQQITGTCFTQLPLSHKLKVGTMEICLNCAQKTQHRHSRVGLTEPTAACEKWFYLEYCHDNSSRQTGTGWTRAHICAAPVFVCVCVCVLVTG